MKVQDSVSVAAESPANAVISVCLASGTTLSMAAKSVHVVKDSVWVLVVILVLVSVSVYQV